MAKLVPKDNAAGEFDALDDDGNVVATGFLMAHLYEGAGGEVMCDVDFRGKLTNVPEQSEPEQSEAGTIHREDTDGS